MQRFDSSLPLEQSFDYDTMWFVRQKRERGEAMGQEILLLDNLRADFGVTIWAAAKGEK